MDIRQFIENIAKKIIEVFAIILFSLITILGCFKVTYLDTAYELKLNILNDNFFFKLLFLIVFFLILKVLAGIIARNREKRVRILVIFVCAFFFLGGVLWSAVSKCFPSADQASVYYAGIHFAGGSYEEICPLYTYLSCYPHQVGLAFYYDVIFRICHSTSYHILQVFNAAFNALSIYSLYRITKIFFRDTKADIYFLLLSVTCIPLIWYTPFVYGELPSLGFIFLGTWMFLEYLQGDTKTLGRIPLKRSYLWAALSIIAITLAVMVRKNTLIFLIALALVLMVYIIKNKDYKKLIFLLIVGITSLTILPAIQSMYEKKAGNQLNDGVPSIAHVAMGLQDSYYAPGWYNGFNIQTYTVTTNYDQIQTKLISKQDIDNSLQKFSDNPGYAYQFFRDKFIAEWLNTGYACFDSTAGKYYDRWPVVESLFSGKLYYVIRSFMAKYQFTIYFFALVWVVLAFRNRKNNIISYVLLVTVIGGALFYIVWEGSGRYILPYFVMTLPYAAAGMDYIGTK